MKPLRRTLEGGEPFHDGARELGATVADFWRWAYSDLAANSTRGLVAEYLVASALGVTSRPRLEWDAVDLVIEDVKVEVKCAGYVQSWPQTRPSSIRFDIAPKAGWDAVTNATATQAGRAADVYVFCVHAHAERETLDVLDVAQWEFYVLSRGTLDERLPSQKTASLSTLLRIGANREAYEALRDAILIAGRRR